MKAFLILCLFFSHVLSAQTLPREQGAEVIRAVKDSLEKHNLNCQSLLVQEYPYPATRLQWHHMNGADVAVNENEQPSILIMKHFPEFSTEIIIAASTDESRTVVTHLRVSRNNLTRVVRNTGTITHPRYEEVTDRILMEDIECK